MVLVGGCATHETYGDPGTPESARAVIAGYSRYLGLYFEDLQIVSVDGQREGGQRGWPYASSVSVPPGMHRVQILILRNSVDIAMCSFEGVFEAGHRYQLRALHHGQALLAHPSSPRFPASLAIVVSASSAPEREVSASAECGAAAH